MVEPGSAKARRWRPEGEAEQEQQYERYYHHSTADAKMEPHYVITRAHVSAHVTYYTAHAHLIGYTEKMGAAAYLDLITCVASESKSRS